MNYFLGRFTPLPIFIFALCIQAKATPVVDSVIVSISPRVIGDTSNRSVREVLTLWSNYLNWVAESGHKNLKNPFWSKAEQYEFKEFDIPGSLLYSSSALAFFRQFQPLVLSIDSIPNGYLLKTAFISLDTDYFDQSLFAIEDVLARRFEGEWRLFRALPYEAKKLCDEKHMGRFTFHYTHGHNFNEQLAHKSVAFVDSLSKMLSIPLRSHYEYYVADNIDEITEVMGMPFCLSMSTGITESEDGSIFTASGLEYYPHELTHLVTGDCGTLFASEGIATWQGGSNYKDGSLPNTVRGAYSDLQKAKDWPLDSVIASEWHFRSPFLFYAAGGMVAALIYHEVGAKGILRLRAAKKANLIPTIESLLKQSNLTVGTIWNLWTSYYLSYFKPIRE